ncbi:uncharacterized protein RCC_01530 [Ramularia collo-cygni]|uniref:Uncharacterized protein n=1 Tax=Ramularia collo-cygni TaxID=112498 RepID=A0A2D3UX47_9PEZI|nr:uncharacterized protein RCC_01530 [Ramularia collo-cygni]CZT15696.1 uncharacterized protein RCC_01530 [Ramularia collo-cygni]
MSSDLFEAFGESPAANHQHVESQEKGSSNAWQVVEEDEDDDFGDFEDASATRPPEQNIPIDQSPKPPADFPPKAPKGAGPSAPSKESKIGKHPFAEHMDFLFSGGDDEYDAGADELNDLATNPEAAMAYSKRIIAEQTARESGGSASTTKLPFAPKPKVQAAAKAVPPARKPNKLRKKSGYAPARDSSILFDVENVSEEEKDDDDDEFGDFTEATFLASTILSAAMPVLTV